MSRLSFLILVVRKPARICFAILGVLGLLLSTNLWACFMPQIWGTLPVHIPIRHAAVVASGGTIVSVSLLLGSWFIPCPKEKRLLRPAIIGLSLALASFIMGKLLSETEKCLALKAGERVNSVIRTYYSSHVAMPSETQVVAQLPDADWSRMRLSLSSNYPSWTLDISSRFVLWSSITFKSGEGWFYRGD